MELTDTGVSAHTIKHGDFSVSLVAGEQLGVGKLNPREVWLLEDVPEGKGWEVNIAVHIRESDA